MNTASKPSGAYRILHTADWHLGKLLNDQSRDQEHGLFLEWLLEVVKGHEIDAIVLAGDVFDTANPPQTALSRYYDFVSALHRQTNCVLVAVAGNHDSAAQLEAPKQVLNALNTHVTGFLNENPKQRLLFLPDAQNPRVALALIPFLKEQDLRVGKPGETAEDIRVQISAGIKRRYEETAEAARGLQCPVLATGHLTVVGAAASDSEREIHIGGLGAVGSDSFPDLFSYVALGHLHRPQATDKEQRVRYAGSPIPLSFSEAGDEKEVRILDVCDTGIEQQAVAVPVFRRLAQVRTTSAGLEQALKEFKPQAGGLRTWVEVVVEDATLGEDLVERVRVFVEKREFDVLKVLRAKASPVSAMSVEEVSDDEALETLLEKPKLVFEHLLSQQEGLTAEECESLKTAFAELVDKQTATL